MDQVVFDARATTKRNNVSRFIEFNEIKMNIGQGMRKDIFIAPHSGYYRFSFSASTADPPTWTYYTEVQVKKNWNPIFNIVDFSHEYANNLSKTWIWKMNEGDKLQFYVTKTNSDYNYLQSSKGSPIIFTGELLYRQDFPDAKP